jgi:lipoprotein
MNRKRIFCLAFLTCSLLSSCAVNNTCSSSSFISLSSSSSTSSSSIEKINLLEKENLQSDYVHWIGRTLYDEEKERVNFYYTATGFEIEFVGTSLSATIFAENYNVQDRRPYFSAFIDDQDLGEELVFTVEKANEKVQLAKDLEYGKHKVKLLKRSEPYDGLTSIQQIKTDGYFDKYNINSSKLKFQILGASGISGHGALGQKGEKRTTKNSSSLHAFGYLTARMFDAETQFVSNSGMGLVWGHQPTNLQKAYEYVGLDKNCNVIEEKWNHQNFVPDAVIVNIGGNDWTSHISNLKDQSAAKKEFRTAVLNTLTNIHSLYPNTFIYWVHTGSNNGTEASTVINDYSKRKQVKVVVMPKVGEDGDPEGANGHNSVITHIKAADIIAEAIEKYTSFSRVKENIKWEY